jgi:hypothetical protein
MEGVHVMKKRRAEQGKQRRIRIEADEVLHQRKYGWHFHWVEDMEGENLNPGRMNFHTHGLEKWVI